MIRLAERLTRSVLRRMTAASRPFILMYHRVAELDCDRWQLAVSPANFDQQIELLRHKFDVVPLTWLVERLRHGRPTGRAVAITFDDGYADVLLNAKPLLEKHDCPATVFLATDAIGSTGGFWWDTLERILLETPILPDRLELKIEGRRHGWSVRANDQGPGCDALTPAELYHALWKLLRALDRDSRSTAVQDLAGWASCQAVSRPVDRALTWEEVRLLCEPGLIDIGAHTLSHPSLPAVSDEDKASEVTASRRVCASVVDNFIPGFSYPFGDHDEASMTAVQAAGFSFACTTHNRKISPQDSLLRLPRIPAMDWYAAQFGSKALQLW